MEVMDTPLGYAEGAADGAPTAEADSAPQRQRLAAGATRIALGPVLYYWPRQRVLDFYESLAGQPVDIVYLGESVCSRRHELRLEDWLEVAARLADAGKEAVLSSLALIESESDLKALRRLVDNGRFSVEANDFGAVRLLAERHLPFVAGPTLNVFNPETLALLAEQGATRWVMPPEMSGAMLAGLLAARPAAVATEAMVWGRLPLAYSARCFTARHYNLQKDTCEFKCLEFPDGLPLQTREGAAFLTINGIQTQSAKVYNLLRDLPALRAAGVDIVRVSPLAQGCEAVLKAFRRCLDGTMTADAAWKELPPVEACNGFWHGRPGLDLVMENAR
jgi:collagenase-like PrtC family protease